MTKVEIPSGHGRGFPNFMTHEEYKNVAKFVGDIFKIKVEVTLHFSENKSGWTNKG